jgi:hypothetical protein
MVVRVVASVEEGKNVVAVVRFELLYFFKLVKICQAKGLREVSSGLW